jgi:hypothetical protein
MNEKGLTEATFKKMFTPQVTTDICQPGKVSWALGFATQNAEPENAFFNGEKASMVRLILLDLKIVKELLYTFPISQTSDLELERFWSVVHWIIKIHCLPVLGLTV